VWDVKRQKCVGTLHRHFGTVTSVAISKDGKYIISGSYDGRVNVWDIDTQEHIIGMTGGKSNHILAIAISNDGKYIASGDDDGIITIWAVRIVKEKYHNRQFYI
jgi:WD40 repeat protein